MTWISAFDPQPLAADIRIGDELVRRAVEHHASVTHHIESLRDTESDEDALTRSGVSEAMIWP